jgi:hypothetical protein
MACMPARVRRGERIEPWPHFASACEGDRELGARRIELAAAGAPATVVAWIAAVAIAVALGLWWFR